MFVLFNASRERYRNLMNNTNIIQIDIITPLNSLIQSHKLDHRLYAYDTKVNTYLSLRTLIFL